jgi:CDP-paratose 2-epimerase
MSAKQQKPIIGLLEWFRPGEEQRVMEVLADLESLGVSNLRTGVSWADWHTESGQTWYRWLLPKLASQVNILPCFAYTPPSLGISGKTSSPPSNPRDYADFIDEMLTEFGKHFEWIELWNEPNNLREWDVTLDPEWQIFTEMVGAAAYWAKKQGEKTVLGGMSPIDPNWLRLMSERGVLQYIDAVGVHGFPGTFDYSWEGWGPNLARVRAALQQNSSSSAQIWITETGFSTRDHNQYQQVLEFTDALTADADRIYWYSAYDLHPDLSTVDGFHNDERDYHFGLKEADGTPKLLFQLWENNGLEGICRAAQMSNPAPASHQDRPALITGGAGFIGTNLANRLLSEGRSVLIYDNLSRPGVVKNLEWLKEQHKDRLSVEIADVRDVYALRKAVDSAAQVFHFAAQVAVTTSLAKPLMDFDVNVKGTLNVLEALRRLDNPPPLVYTSTNKVYGCLESLNCHVNKTRYEPTDPWILSDGICESCSLDFHSPYGCSKGAADQYVRDYSRIYGLPTVIFRMSCIYGPHQFGTEDQGWVAHFLMRAIDGLPLTIYGDGLQVRDVLFVEDIVNAFLLAVENIDKVSGNAFNIGGGTTNTLSVLELVDLIGEIHGQRPAPLIDVWRQGDQRYYVSDIRKFRQATGWTPQINVREGISRLYQWLLETQNGLSYQGKGLINNAVSLVKKHTG